MPLIAIPITLQQANAFVDKFHRHHAPSVGHKLSIGCYCLRKLKLVGVAILGRPVSRGTDHHWVLEVSRLCTDGTKNACSFLYSRSARIAQEMGYRRIQTYILESEKGTSLTASGWKLESTTQGGNWVHTAGPRRQDQPTCRKQRWSKDLNDYPGWLL